MKSMQPDGHNWNEMSDDAFRALTVSFIEENLPTELRFMKRRPIWTECREWYQRMARGGWLVPNWPARYGGMGLSPAKQVIVAEEMERRGGSFCGRAGRY